MGCFHVCFFPLSLSLSALTIAEHRSIWDWEYRFSHRKTWKCRIKSLNTRPSFMLWLILLNLFQSPAAPPLWKLLKLFRLHLQLFKSPAIPLTSSGDRKTENSGTSRRDAEQRDLKLVSISRQTEQQELFQDLLKEVIWPVRTPKLHKMLVYG